MTENPLIKVENVQFGYRFDKQALTGVSLDFPRGARIALVGPNGAGKSTLFLHLNAILRPVSGRLFYEGRPYGYGRDAVAALRRRVGLVFQDQDIQLFAASVLDDVMFGPLNLGLSVAAAESCAREALALLDIPSLASEPIHGLSQGQKKRVAVAGVLAMDPEVLVMDEPTAGLDYPGILSLREMLAGLHVEGRTLIVATHDIDWVWSWADLVYVLHEGRVIAGGPPENIINNEEHASRGISRPVIGELTEAFARAGIRAPAGARSPRTVAELVEMVLANGNI